MDLRQDAWHELASELVATRSDVVIEDLDMAAMKRSIERQAFYRSVSDAPLGFFAPTVGYKAEGSGVNMPRANR